MHVSIAKQIQKIQKTMKKKNIIYNHTAQK